jgi:hypothetical protein
MKKKKIKVTPEKLKQKKNWFNFKLPIVGIVSLLISVYFLLEPNVTIVSDILPELSIVQIQLIDANDKKYFYLQNKFSLAFYNSSIKSGIIDSIEVITDSENGTVFEIDELEFDKKPIRWRQMEMIDFKVTLRYEAMQNQEGVYLPVPITFRFLNNNGSHILERDDETVGCFTVKSAISEDSVALNKQIL